MSVYQINAGHCVQGFDTGAQGCGFKEEILTRKVVSLITQKLERLGHTVINCTIDGSTSVAQALNGICTKANAVMADFFISIHFNASNGAGHGVEVFTYGGKEVPQAKNILNNIVGLGYRDRGIKDGKGLAVIRNTKATAMLLECCFIDNVEDMRKFDAEDMANAIVKGLTGQAVISEKSTKVNYVLEFQKFYNNVTKTGSPIEANGVMGNSTEKAYITLGKLMRGEY